MTSPRPSAAAALVGDRRGFLGLGISTAAVIASAPAVARVGAPAERPPPDIGRKFRADGRVMPFAGNTIICHLPQQGEGSEAFAAVLDIYRALPACGFARKITALPPSSYHMTVFGGANDKDRRRPLWPAGLPLDMPIGECADILGDRLRDFRLGEDGPPYRMRIDPAEPPATETPLTIRLLPVDERETLRLRRLRDRLSALLGIRAPAHDAYRFHITWAYLIDWLTPVEAAEFRAALNGWRATIGARCPVVSLDAPEYCVFDDMFAFERQFYLS